MTQKVLDEKKLLEILDVAKIGEQQLKEISEMATAMAEKYQGWYEKGMARKRTEEGEK